MNHILTGLIYAILFCVGYNFTQDEYLRNNIELFGYLSLLIMTCVLGMNALSLIFYEKITKKNTHHTHTVEQVVPRVSLREVVMKITPILTPMIAGVFLGVLSPAHTGLSGFLTQAVDVLLVLIMWFIGAQLYTDNISLKTAFTSRLGIKISVLIMLSSWLTGLILYPFINLPLNEILAVVSGFGWYSLSAPLLSSQLSGFHGSLSLLLEVNREISCIILLPLFIKRFPMTTIGISGTSAMDFLLPLIKKHGDSQLLPVAITSGMILSTAAPIAMLGYTVWSI